MRYFRIFFLHFQQISQHRARSFVWFLLSLYSPLVLLLFWRGVFKTNSGPAGLTLNELTTYYLLLVIAGSTLVSHIEDSVANIDIQEGGLVKYLLRPLSYYWFKFFEEIHHRILQGLYGVIVMTLATLYFGPLISFPTDPTRILFICIMSLLAYFISFTFKMCLSFTAFWTTDIWGIYEIMEVATIIFGGFTLPLHLLPFPIEQIAYSLPFAYIVYFPVIAFQGLLSISEIYRVIFFQIGWLAFFIILYNFLWIKGLKQFTGVGQ